MIIIVGATSAIGNSIAREYARQGNDLIVCARNKKKLKVIVEDVKARSNVKVHGIIFDACDLGAQKQAMEHMNKLGRIEGMVLVQGYMPPEDSIKTEHEEISKTVAVNMSSVMNLGNLFAQGHGFFAVVTSIAGERGKGRNLLYNAAKGGASVYLDGLRQASKLDIIEIRPGWIDTRMTYGLVENPLVYPREKAAKAIIKGIKKKKRIVYVPGFWRYIMIGMRNMPNIIWDRLKL